MVIPGSSRPRTLPRAASIVPSSARFRCRRPLPTGRDAHVGIRANRRWPVQEGTRAIRSGWPP